MNDEQFDQLMQHFRTACVETAARESTAAARPRKAAWQRTAPAFATLLIAATAGITAVSLHHRHPAAATAHANPAQPAPAVSDDALLSAVDEDLSDRVPQALAPLAVSYTNSSASGQNQKE